MLCSILKAGFLSRPNFNWISHVMIYDHRQTDQKMIVQSLGFHAGLCVGWCCVCCLSRRLATLNETCTFGLFRSISVIILQMLFCELQNDYYTNKYSIPYRIGFTKNPKTIKTWCAKGSDHLFPFRRFNYRWNHVVDGTMQCDHIFVWSSCESIPMAGALRIGLPYQTARLKKKNGKPMVNPRYWMTERPFSPGGTANWLKTNIGSLNRSLKNGISTFVFGSYQGKIPSSCKHRESLTAVCPLYGLKLGKLRHPATSRALFVKITVSWKLSIPLLRELIDVKRCVIHHGLVS